MLHHMYIIYTMLVMKTDCIILVLKQYSISFQLFSNSNYKMYSFAQYVFKQDASFCTSLVMNTRSIAQALSNIPLSLPMQTGLSVWKSYSHTVTMTIVFHRTSLCKYREEKSWKKLRKWNIKKINVWNTKRLFW